MSEIRVCIGISNPIVTIAGGQVRGKKQATILKSNTYYAFQGIPFAVPPIGSLRFEPPVKAPGWSGILNATYDRPQCVQTIDAIVGSEDCLYTNVYTPSLTRKNISVMVWIHGGGFMYSNSSYDVSGPDYLLDEDVIFVAMNYRMGIFGFSSTNDLISPGNCGIKDTILGLKWVQENIKYFGGDPQKVTIFGESAGAAIVSYLVLSPLAAGLFSGAIMESGTALDMWALSRRAKNATFEVGRQLKINTTSSTTLIAGLKQVNYRKLQNVSYTISGNLIGANLFEGIPFGPVYEPVHSGAVVTSKSHQSLFAGNFNRVPAIIGVNSQEAGVINSVTWPFLLLLERFDLNPFDLVPLDLNPNLLQRTAAASRIRTFYFNILPISAQRSAFVQFMSDTLWNRPDRQAAIEQNKYAPTYFYVFSFEGIVGNNNISSPGAVHSQELNYIFRRKENPLTSSRSIPAADALTRARLCRLWTNFAKTGNPTPEREPVLNNVTWIETNTVLNNFAFLNISNLPQVQVNPFSRYMNFWDDIYRTLGQPPYGTH